MTLMNSVLYFREHMSVLTHEYNMYDEHGFLSSNNIHNDSFKAILQNYRDDDKFFDPETESINVIIVAFNSKRWTSL
jgi:hypothetical protein